jgi:Ca-activated chloride channel family protein
LVVRLLATPLSGLLFAALPVTPQTQQPPDIRVDVDLVTVACSVTDHDGAPVKNLKLEDFTLRDNGQPRQIRNFWQEQDLPLTIALVADVSGSQAGFVKSHRDAVAQFLQQVMGPRDRAMIAEVARDTRLISGLTGSLDELSAAVEKIGTAEGKHSPLLGPPCRNSSVPRSCGGTALWHALYYAALELKPVPGRKAMVVLSDGMDTGSDVTLANLIETAQSAEAVVYSIKYENPMRFLSITATIVQAASRGMERLSRETGGVTFQNPGRKTAEVFAAIESDLRNMYVLGFTPPDDAHDGKFHKLEVKSTRSGLIVRARAGYWSQGK